MEAFEKFHIAGTRNLINLALAADYRPKFIFMSSIAAASIPGVSDTIPEAPVKSIPASGMGYGHSKFIGERICEAAAEKAALPVTIVRVGQIS